MRTSPITQLGFLTLAIILMLGCSSTGGKYENSDNTAYLDGEGKRRGLFGGRQKKKSAQLPM